MSIIEGSFRWLMNEPPSLGRCAGCRKWFIFRLLRKEPGQFGPTEIYQCGACGHEKRYESLPPRSRYTLG
ncbi:MAG TPA: hypothetical protein VGP76_00815 [Planctomycetaceae bacterium]|jgi:hypothetical protein|nr:hypothetical protein [Planctomycetaceae bacterium]